MSVRVIGQVTGKVFPSYYYIRLEKTEYGIAYVVNEAKSHIVWNLFKTNYCLCDAVDNRMCICDKSAWPIWPLWAIRHNSISYVVHPEDSEIVRNYFSVDQSAAPAEQQIDRLIDSIQELVNEIRYNPALNALSTLESKHHFNSEMK